MPNSSLWIPEITFVIVTFNEESRLPNVIKNFRSYGRILIVDNYSSDETVEIAHAHGCDVLMNKNNGWVEDFETMERIKAQVQTEWMYWGCADELISKEALADIARVINTDQADVISIVRKNYLYGEFCHNIAVARQTKVLKKSAIDFQNNTIHNFGRILVGRDRIYRMPPDKFVHHLISNTASSYLDTINRYTELEVATKSAVELNRPTYYYLLLPLKVLWQDYFLKGGRQAGHVGLALSALMLIYSLMKAVKGYEAVHTLDPNSIQQCYEKVASELLADFK